MRRVRSILAALVASLALALDAAGPARADFKVQMPDAEYGEWEIEPLGSYGMSKLPALNNEQSFVPEFGYGVTNFWHTEIGFETARDPGPNNHLKFVQLTTENQFQFTERGQYWLDPGFFFEYGQVLTRGAPNEIKFGPILRKQIGPTINTINLFFKKDIGAASSGRASFTYAIETRLALGTVIEPGIQAYGTPGPFGHFAPASQQDHRVGPQLFATINQLGPGTLKMNGGLLFGLTPAAPRRTLRWQFEYEVHF